MENFLVYMVVAAVLFLPTWLVFRRLKNTRKHAILISAIIAAMLAPAAFFVGFLGLLLIPGYGSERFRPEKWLENPHRRYKMADDIIAKKLLLNKDSLEVKRLLGTSGVIRTSNFWRYDLGGHGSGFGLAFHSLTIHFSNGTVTNVEHARIQD